MMSRFLPELASAHGVQIDHLMDLVHLLMLVLLVGWGALFVYILFRFRQGRNPKADHDGLKSHASTWVEGGVALAEVVLLIGFSIPLYSARVDDLPPEDEALVVRVVGEQFAWNVHYPGPDGIFGRTAPELVDTQTNPLGIDLEDPAAADDVTTVNQLHLEVNRPVLVHLSSKDVIHSFNLPEMRVKQDAVPGLEIPVWFIPTMTTAGIREARGDDEAGFEIACTQLCGLGHYRMRGFVTVQEPADFQAWMDEQVAAQQTSGEDAFWQ